MIIMGTKPEKLVCGKCGQGDFGWRHKRSQMWCDFCKVVTHWITERAYKKQKEKEHNGNRCAAYR